MVPLEDSGRLARSFLLQRLKWPVPMTRWRTAKEIRNLLNDPSTQASSTNALLDYLDQCKTESEVCEILTIVLMTSQARRPAHKVLVSRIHCPSVLADMILERIYGRGFGIGGWCHSHSGRAPENFKNDSYFEEHKTAHVAPILLRNLKKLEGVSGYPFAQHWAYEWKTLRNKLGTHFTRYPHYFDDVLDARSGIVGQYWQRMREVYISAYLRTLAFAVSELHMPQNVAESYCVDVVHGIAGLFDVEPHTRPTWLSDFPEQFCAPNADFEPLSRELVNVARTEGMRLVSLDAPVALPVQKFAKLTLSAHLVTSDYKLPEAAFLYEKTQVLSIADTFELKGPFGAFTIEQASTKGETGDEVAVCSSLLPLPFGTWQGDYFSVGLRIPAPYSVPNTSILCTRDSIDCIASDGGVASRTRLWNDNWVPPHPKGGSTRCGLETMIDEKLLSETMSRLKRKLTFFVRLQIWDREKDYGDYIESQRTIFLHDL